MTDTLSKYNEQFQEPIRKDNTMRITKVKYHNGIVDVAYEVLKELGQVDEFTLRSGDTPLPAFLNALMFLRVFALRMLELPDTDEEIKKVTVRSVKFDYSDKGVMGAVVSGVRTLQHSRGVMILNSPHRFEESGDKKMLLEGKCIEHLNTLLEEAEKYVNGERAQEQMKFDAKPETKKEKSAEEIISDAVDKKKKKEQPENGKALSDKTIGQFYVKSKGKNVSIAAGFANRLTELVNEPQLLNPSSDHKNMWEIGNGTAILFEKVGNILEIHSAKQDEKPIAGKKLKKNVVEEIIKEIESWVFASICIKDEGNQG